MDAVILGSIIFSVFVLGSVLFYAVLWWMIFKKAGYPGPLGLLTFVPLVNVMLFIVFAFMEWPIQKELETLRRKCKICSCCSQDSFDDSSSCYKDEKTK